jgi:hypothetical protein
MRALAAIQFAICIAVQLGCAQGGSINDSNVELPCKPFETRECPCIDGSSGTQTCSRSGLSFGSCRGCEVRSADGGVSFATLDDGSALDSRNAQPGIVCGVGLPLLCQPQSEKCCTRSLSVDTCIADDAQCACDLPDCDVVEIRCDGPEDCAEGQVCCGTLVIEDSGGAHYSGFSCAAQCTAQQNLACHEHGQVCPSGLLCADSQLIPNVQICVDPASLQQ